MSDNTPTQEELASLEENQEEETQQQHGSSTPGQSLLALVYNQVVEPLIQPRLRMRFASQVLKDPHLAKNMLDVRNPKKIQQVREKLKLGPRLQKEKGDYRLTHEELIRRRYSSIIAQRHHSRVDTLANDMKLQSAAARYGVDETALRQKVEAYKKQNPGRSVDEALVISSQQLHNDGLIQKGEKIDEKGLTKQYKKDAREMYSEFSQTREKAIEKIETDPHEKAITEGYEKAINKWNDLNTPLPSTPQERAALLKKDVQEAETGRSATTSPTPPAQQPAATPISQRIIDTPQPPVVNVSPTSIASHQTAIHQPLPQPIPQHNAVNMPIKAPVAPSVPSVSIPSIPTPNISPSFFQNIFGDLFKSLQTQLAHIGQKISSTIGKLTSKITGRLGKLAGRAFKAVHVLFNKAVDLGRKLLRRGIDAIAPGLGTAIGTLSDIVRKTTGGLIDPEGFIIKGVMKFLIITTACFVGIVILSIVVFVSAIPSFSGQDSSSMKITSLTPQMSWSQFENKYLTYSPMYTKNTNLTWNQFVSRFLYASETYLSFGKP